MRAAEGILILGLVALVSASLIPSPELAAPDSGWMVVLGAGLMLLGIFVRRCWGKRESERELRGQSGKAFGYGVSERSSRTEVSPSRGSRDGEQDGGGS